MTDKPIMDRATFACVWRMLGRQITRHDALASPHTVAIQELESQMFALAVAAGFDGEPVEWCEICGAPFKDGDDYVRGDDVAHCRPTADENYPDWCHKDAMGRARAALGMEDAGHDH